jgi:multicomponent Na+:H+ antiporter subunit B
MTVRRWISAALALAGTLTMVGWLLLEEDGPGTVMPPPMAIETIAAGAGVPNVVSAIILDGRLYDTVAEVVVFTLASLGVGLLLRGEKKASRLSGWREPSSQVLARIGSTVNAIVAIELALRGHLTPGGGFAAGVAGGTAIGLLLVGGASEVTIEAYRRWQVGLIEESAVLLFLVMSCLVMEGFQLPLGVYGTTLSGGMLPILNVLVGIKVTLGSWGMVQNFLRTQRDL